MDENVQTAATTTEAPVTESAPVEASTDNGSITPSEKTPNTVETPQDGQEGGQVDAQGQLIPKARLDEVIAERNELRKWREEQEAQRVEQERLANMTPTEQAQIQEREKAKAILKPIIDELGYVSKEEQIQREQEQKAANMFISECNRLEGKYDGKDGSPAFKAEEIAAYMDELAAKGQVISDPETAYRLKNYDAIVDAAAKAQRSSTYSEKQQGGMNQVDDTRNSELEAAAKTGDYASFLKKHAPMPQR